HTLRMTRSIGDKRYELHGLIHHPEITFFEVDLDEGQRAFIVTACDGLTERMHPAKDSKQKKSEFEEQEIGTCVATTIDDCKSKNIESEIAFRLTEKAVNTGSTDNISIIVKEVTHQKNPHIGAVFDGHGGNKVSKALGKHTIPLFKDLIELKNLLKNPLNQVKQNHERSSKKEMLDPLVDKIFSLNRRGGQSEKLYALTKIYFALKKLNLSDPSAVTTYHELIIKNLKNFESFSSRLGKFGAWIKQSIFKTVYTETISDTRLLAGKLLDWVENNALPKQRIIDKIRQNISF
ncbi:MAG: hypothetical protein JO131_09485, partial [Gammaproteobacteria bacterium]|nr:hypothetical protein [Gammaproteobacteria bacterium]